MKEKFEMNSLGEERERRVRRREKWEGRRWRINEEEERRRERRRRRRSSSSK